MKMNDEMIDRGLELLNEYDFTHNKTLVKTVEILRETLEAMKETTPKK